MAVFEQKKSNKITLDDTVPLTCTIETAHNVKDHTQYMVKVQRGPVPENSWTVAKRYSDFDALDASLKVAGIDLPLPPKKVFGKMDREFVAERQQGLQNYLNALMDQPMLASSLLVKRFLDPTNYTFNLQEVALQHISMFFRSENKWEVIEPAPDIGWRIRKKYFVIKDKHQPREKYMLSWSTLGPDKFLDDRDLEYTMKLLPSFNHPHIGPVLFATSNETSGIAIRPLYERGTLRDHICRVQKPRLPFFKKYSRPKQIEGCQLHEIKLFGRQILDTLKYMHDKGFPYGHLHAGNVLVDVANNRVRLLDVENWLLGVPAYYRPYFTQFRKISTLESVDVYSFGQLMYEMAFGEQLGAATCDSLPPICPPELRSVLESILTPEACKNGLPSIANLLTHPFFCQLVLPPGEKPQIKIPSKAKEALREARGRVEARLKEEQKSIHQYKRLSKAQAYHMSDEEKKKRRRNKKKQLSQVADEGPSPHESNGLTNHSGVDMPPVSQPPAPSPTSPATGAPPPPPPPPMANISPAAPQAPTPPPQAPPTPAEGGANPGRTALLGSIQNFSKKGLKKAVTVDKSTPKI